ncbi:MAG: AI-2E family transporter [Eubacteriaceae bacterium]|jgi:predicted PurR-regulated permease PerM|nr:AI-2E family transporter [Eubacteriaceae bacterium]
MELNKKNVRTILFIVITGIVAFTLLQNFDQTISFARWVVALFKPMLNGVLLTLILIVPMRVFQNHVFSHLPIKQGLRKLLSLIATLLSAIAVIFFVLFMVVPSLIETINDIVSRIPGFVTSIQKLASSLIEKYPELTTLNELIEQYPSLNPAQLDLTTIGNNIIKWVTDFSTSLIGSTFGFLTNFIGGLVSFFIGLVFAIYALLMKERLTVQFKGLAYAYLPTKAADQLVYVARLTNTTFSNYLAGQSIEAGILATMTFIIMMILQVPSLSFMIACLVGVCTFVPIFGNFVALFVGSFLILLISPLKALGFILLFMLMQQLEGGLIYPNVVGKKVGLPPVWVLFAVTLGSNTFGVLGMILFIPLTSVAYTILKTKVFHRLKNRKIPAEKIIEQAQTKVPLDGNTPVEKIFSPPAEDSKLRVKPIVPSNIIEQFKKPKKK